jgi:hypothetical protein
MHLSCQSSSRMTYSVPICSCRQMSRENGLTGTKEKTDLWMIQFLPLIHPSCTYLIQVGFPCAHSYPRSLPTFLQAFSKSLKPCSRHPPMQTSEHEHHSYYLERPKIPVKTYSAMPEMPDTTPAPSRSSRRSRVYPSDDGICDAITMIIMR